MRIFCELSKATIDTYNNDILNTMFVLESLSGKGGRYAEPLPFILETKLEDKLVLTDPDSRILDQVAYFLLYNFDITIHDIEANDSISYKKAKDSADKLIILNKIDEICDRIDNCDSQKEKRILQREVFALEAQIGSPKWIDIEQTKIDTLKEVLLSLSNLNMDIKLENDNHKFRLTTFNTLKEALDFYRKDLTDKKFSKIYSTERLALMQKLARIKDPSVSEKDTIQVLIDKINQLEDDDFDPWEGFSSTLFGYSGVFPSTHVYFNILNDGANETNVRSAFEFLWITSVMKRQNISFERSAAESSFFHMNNFKHTASAFEHMAKLLQQRDIDSENYND